MDPDQYCREVESYLCRKNDGHLIRIAGPSFELVCGWAARGIPLKVAVRGIDRYFERYYARRPRRHPVRIDFCDPDVLDVFDEWRRAVGVARTTSSAHPTSTDPKQGSLGEGADASSVPVRPRRSLVAHVDGIIGRLAARRTNPDTASQRARVGNSATAAERGCRVGDPATPALDSEILRTIERLENLREVAAKSRGHARVRLIDDLAELDRTLGAAARESCPGEVRAVLAHDAAADLEPFRERMPAATYQRALDSCIDRLLREQLGLPRIAYE